MKHRGIFAAMVVLSALALAGCSWTWNGGGEPPTPPPPPLPPEPVVGIVMTGEALPAQWQPLPYRHYYEGQYITFSLYHRNIEIERVDWGIWPDDWPEGIQFYSGTECRDYFYGTLCSDPGPRKFIVRVLVTDTGGTLYMAEDEFYIHRLKGG